MHNRACVWKAFDSERVNESKKRLKSAEKYFYPGFPWSWAKLSYKKLFLIRSKILRVLDNTLTRDWEYSRSNKKNLRNQLKSNYLKNHRIFVGVFFSFLVSTWRFQCSEKKQKMSLLGQVFLKLLTPKDVLINMHKRAFVWKSFGSERVNESEKLLKSAEKYFYSTFSSFWAKLS